MRGLKMAAALLGATFAVPASATVITADSINYQYGNIYGGIGYQPTNFMEVGPAGQFQFLGHNAQTNAAFSALTWCVDIFTAVNDQMFRDFEIVSLNDFLSNSTKIGQLAALVTHADAEIAAAGDYDSQNATAAALQLAIWEVLYEQGTSGYSVSGGDFYTYGSPNGGSPFQSLWSRADAYLMNVSDGSWNGSALNVAVLRSEDNQSQVYVTPPPAVPEPATWMMLITGFGLVGAALRRARKDDAAQALTA